jgi:hypothetical protein
MNDLRDSYDGQGVPDRHQTIRAPADMENGAVTEAYKGDRTTVLRR